MSGKLIDNCKNESLSSLNNGQTKIFEDNTSVVLNGQTYLSGVIDFEAGNIDQILRTRLVADQDGVLRGFWYDSPAKNRVLRPFQIPYVAGDGISLTGTEVFGRYLEYEFENTSGTDQTFFNLVVFKSNVPLSGQLIRVNQFVPDNVLAQLTRSILTGVDSNGIYQNVGVNQFGALQNVSLILDAARGFYPGITARTKFGRNPGISTGSTPEDVWNGSTIYTGQPVGIAPTTLEIRSTSTDDSASGIGARTVELEGLDPNGDIQKATVTLNGTNWVTIPTLLWFRQSRGKVLTAGSSGRNQGAIETRWTGQTFLFMSLPPGANQSAICCDTVPRGKVRVIYSAQCRIARLSGQAGSANVRLLVREQGSTFQTKINEEITTDSPYQMSRDSYIVVPELADIKWSVESVSDNNTVATAAIPYLDFDL